MVIINYGNELRTTKRVGVLKKNGTLTSNNEYLLEQYMDINNINECIVICQYKRKVGNQNATK